MQTSSRLVQRRLPLIAGHTSHTLALPCLAQTGQLNIETLPANYRTTADQLGYVEMAFP